MSKSSLTRAGLRSVGINTACVFFFGCRILGGRDQKSCLVWRVILEPESAPAPIKCICLDPDPALMKRTGHGPIRGPTQK